LRGVEGFNKWFC